MWYGSFLSITKVASPIALDLLVNPFSLESHTVKNTREALLKKRRYKYRVSQKKFSISICILASKLFICDLHGEGWERELGDQSKVKNWRNVEKKQNGAS